MARFFIDRPIFAWVLAIILMIFGGLSLSRLPIAQYPAIAPPTVSINATYPGASAKAVQDSVTQIIEQSMKGLDGLLYMSSTSESNGSASITLTFANGTDPDIAQVQVQNKLSLATPSLPQIVQQNGINVSKASSGFLLVIGFVSEDPSFGGDDLQDYVSSNMVDPIARVPGVGSTQVFGAKYAMRIWLDPNKLDTYKLTPGDVTFAVRAQNQQVVVGQLGGTPAVKGQQLNAAITAQDRLQTPEQFRQILVRSNPDGSALRLGDVARVELGSEDYSIIGHFNGKPATGIAVSLATGANAISTARGVEAALKELAPSFPKGLKAVIPFDTTPFVRAAIEGVVTTLFEAVLLVFLVMFLFLQNFRATLIPTIAVPVVLLGTLGVLSVLGFSVNMLTMFAMVLAIGLLVDDAIVVVENIHRHYQLGWTNPRQATIYATDEVGNPTILATFTVIGALLPLAFVSGLMGPYMRPIPINASAAMLFSLVVAFVVSPWLTYRLFKKHATELSERKLAAESALPDTLALETVQEDRLHRLYQRLFRPLLESRPRRFALLAGVAVLLLASMTLFPLRIAAVKMLPHDNKSELQVVIDMPEGTTLEHTAAVAREMALALRELPEVTDIETYVGTSAPFNFNGLVRHYFLRSGPLVADLQVNLLPKHDRETASHPFAKTLRPLLSPIAARHGANVKVTEVPPGPPVLSTLVAEIYAATAASRLDLAGQVKAIFEGTAGVVDVDWFVEGPGPRLEFEVDREKASRAGVSPEAIARTLRVALAGADAAHLSDPRARGPVPVVLRLDPAQRAGSSELLAVAVPGNQGSLVPLSELVRPVATASTPFIYHKNLRPVTYVVGDVAGASESPVYALLDMKEKIAAVRDASGRPMEVLFTGRPADSTRSTLIWDGEWQVTHDVFLDMGIAFAVVMVLIYLLVVGWFGSFVTPLIIMAPIPLTLIGVIPAHAFGGVFFTATSMIGVIALAGIIVRNSILLVDFINLELKTGEQLDRAVIKAAAVRFRPIALTAAALVVGGVVILLDPIFQGLAVALISGVVVSTALTLVLVPLLYWMYVATVGIEAVVEVSSPEENNS